MKKRGGQAARDRKKPSTQPAFDPQGWMDGGKEGKRMQKSGNLEGDDTTSSG